MSAEDKQKIAALETELRELKELLAGLSVSRDTLKAGVQEQGQAIKGVAERLTVIEGRTVMNVPAWAEPAVQAASAAGLLDTPSGGSYDFYRILTVLNRAGLLVTSKGVAVMYNDALNNVLAFASVLAVFVMALVQLVKNSVTLPRNVVPAVGLIIGLLVGAAAYPFTDMNLILRLWAGGLAGLSATGLFELAFNKRSGTTKEE